MCIAACVAAQEIERWSIPGQCCGLLARLLVSPYLSKHRLAERILAELQEMQEISHYSPAYQRRPMLASLMRKDLSEDCSKTR